jgi:hypothetical protein
MSQLSIWDFGVQSNRICAKLCYLLFRTPLFLCCLPPKSEVSGSLLRLGHLSLKLILSFRFTRICNCWYSTTLNVQIVYGAPYHTYICQNHYFSSRFGTLWYLPGVPNEVPVLCSAAFIVLRQSRHSLVAPLTLLDVCNFGEVKLLIFLSACLLILKH